MQETPEAEAAPSPYCVTPDPPDLLPLLLSGGSSHFPRPNSNYPATSGCLYIAFPVVSQLGAGSTLIRPPHLSHLRFESFDTLRCYSHPPFPIQSKAEELTFLNPPCTALGGIHLQSQMLLNPFLYRRQRSFRRSLTVDVNITVIRIPAVGMPPLIQFLIERVQIDVRQ